MITYVFEDLFRSPAQVIVNPVNTVGVMGKGLAKDFKQIYPEMFRQYQQFCEQGLFDVGNLWIYKTSHKWVLNFPTKKHWRNKSRLEYIEAGLQKFADTYDIKGITSISFPQLGCGNGELDWATEVQPLMQQYLGSLPIDILIHIYSPDEQIVPEHRDIQQIENWLRNQVRSLAFDEFWHDVIRLIRQQIRFNTLGDNPEEFEVIYDEAEDALVFSAEAQERFAITRDAFTYFWQRFRAAGFLSSSQFPEGFDTKPDHIISLLANFQYIKPIKLKTSDAYEPEVGIQLISISARDQVPEALKAI